MKKYTFGQRVFAVTVHQICMIVMIDSLFAMNYFAHLRMRQPIGNFGLLSIIGLAGNLLSLAFLANMEGEQEEHGEDNKRRHFLTDRIDSDIFLLLFVFFIAVMVRAATRLRHQNFTLAGLLITAGCFSYIMDLVFLCFYLSIMRRIKQNILFTGSRTYKTLHFFREMYDHRGKGYPHSRKARERVMLQEAIEHIAAGALDTTLDESFFHGQERSSAVAINHIRDGLQDAVQESTRNERMKVDLITNVSHDIKTPLTSIVNYAELLKREELENQTANNYIRIIDEKAQRLKQLVEDLMEVSKISSGNIKLDMQGIDLVELLYQTGGEFNERFEDRGLTIVTKLPHSAVMICADGRQLYRVIENLYTNAAKYALENSRVYVELTVGDGKTVFTIKNISKNPIQMEDGNTSSLTERFVRGEVSRTTEGSGLGLSIAKSLTQLMGGEFGISVEDDLFIASITFQLN